MSLFAALDTSASGLTAERTRLDVIASNIANAGSTRRADGRPGPYLRRYVVFEPRGGATVAFPFAGFLANPPVRARPGDGVRIVEIAEDRETPTVLRYDPAHADARPDGFVEMPNVNVVIEMADMITASRAYEMNLTAVRNFRTMWQDAVRLLG